MLAAAGPGLLEIEEIPSCLVHLFRVGLRGFFFPQLSCNLKMEIADSKGILSVVPISVSFEREWPAADRGASSQEFAGGQ